MDYITQPKDYWIARDAINITLNAMGNPNRTLATVSGGAAILCYIEGIEGLEYDNGHHFKTWPLSISPTKFNSNTAKYVYVAIPRTVKAGTQAIVVFPSEKLDIYGKNAGNAQIGSTDYYYIWLQGIITATDGTSNREWGQAIDFGRKGTDEDLYDDTSSDWYQYSKVSEVVTFLKPIFMKAGSYFHNLILDNKELTGVATSDIAYTDSDTLVATPGYVESQYLSKTHESEAQEQIGFLKGLWIGVRNLYEITANGIAKLKSVIAEDITANRVTTDNIKSSNYTGEGVADTGFRLTNAYNGHSKLTIDEIYVRMKAVFESLEVRERTYTGGDQIWSCAGNRIVRVDYLGNVEDDDHVPQMMNVHADGRPSGQGQGDVYSVPVPGDTYGYSDVKVPWLLRQMPLLARAKVFARYRKVRIVINEPAGNSANRAAASESPLANIRRARCYFLAKDDDMEVHNWWRINDLARCQTMNLANTTRQTYISGEDEKAGNIFWWRKVIGVSYEPVTLDDGKQYHYFDVAFDYLLEQEHPERMVTSVMKGSDIPAAQDSVVQFGNTIIEGRMNLMMMEVNGGDAVGYNPTTDAPCLKAYRGVYCFDLNKSWVGGRTGCCKMKLSPSTGYEFYGPNFKQVTEYDVVPVPVDRGLWIGIKSTRDDYEPHADVRKCYYYDKVSHNGSYWLCSIVDGTHWVNGDGNYISDDDYAALTEEQKALCSRKQNYTIEEPSANSTDWTEVVQKGDKGDKGDKGEGVPEYMQTQEAWSNDGATANAYTAPTTEHGRTDGTAAHAAEADWHDTTPDNANNYAYLWRRSRKMVLKSDGTYEPEKNEQGTLTDDGRWSYARLSGTNGTSIRTKGTVVAVEAGSVTLPTTGVSSGDAGIKQGDAHLWKFNGTAWTQETAASADGDSYTVIKDCIVDLEQDGTSININGHLVMWSEEANDGNGAWVDLGEFKGERGVNGKDGWMITANPANVIITQALDDNLTSFSSVKVSFTAKKGSVPATVSSLAIPTGRQVLSNEFDAAIGTGDDSKKVIVSSPKTYTPQGGTAQYYTEGTFVVDVIVTDPDTNSSVTFNVTVPCYANLLGTWKREVEGGVETVVAGLTRYLEDEDGNIITSKSLRKDINDATQDLSELSQTVTTQGQTIQNQNVRLSTAEGNINTVSKFSADFYADAPSEMNAGKLSGIKFFAYAGTYYLSIGYIDGDAYGDGFTVEIIKGQTSVHSIHLDEGEELSNYELQLSEGEYYIIFADSSGSLTGTIHNISLRGAPVAQSLVKQTADEIKLAVGNTGIDIDNKTINLSGANIIVTTGGTKTALFENGIVKMDYLDANQIVVNGIRAKEIDAGNAKFSNVTVNGVINASSGSITGPMSITGVLTVGDANGRHMIISPSVESNEAGIRMSNGTKDLAILSFGQEGTQYWFPHFIMKHPNVDNTSTLTFNGLVCSLDNGDTSASFGGRGVGLQTVYGNKTIRFEMSLAANGAISLRASNLTDFTSAWPTEASIPGLVYERNGYLMVSK